MSEQTEYKVDRTGWAPGAWDLEPEDRIEWRHQGIACVMVRVESHGGWCGYVALPAGHPWRDCADVSALDIEVHGGITYGPAACFGHVCHVPQPGESDDVRWIGFDCVHSGDLSPAYTKHGLAFRNYETYRDRAYVRAEVESLAKQAIAAGVL